MDNGPILSDSSARKDSIVNNTPAVFIVEENPAAHGSEPFYELEIASQVAKWCGIIQSVATKHGVDPSLAKAIMFMETTHGWYDKFYPFRKTILLSRIAARIKDPTPKKIATVYNFVGANKVNSYGARVAKIMRSKPWVKRGCAA